MSTFHLIKPAKITFIFISLFIVFIGLIPIKNKALANKKIIFSLLNTFAAGVFLAMALFHLLPEAVEYYSEVTSSSSPDTLAEESEHSRNYYFNF